MKYLVSGIGPGSSGVGRLMKALVPEYKELGYEIIYKKETKSIKYYLSDRKYFSAVREFLLRWFYHLKFYYKLFFIKNSDVVFIHPQTAGFSIFLRLVERNRVRLYVMDNSFFCLQSYNTHPVTKVECLRCLGNALPDQQCVPFPVKVDKNKNIYYINKLKELSEGLSFLAQNKMQALLLSKHFGTEIKIEIIGMDTKEVDVEVNAVIDKHEAQFDFVYHGASIVPKGIQYFVGLAKAMPDYSFFVPDEEKRVVEAVKCDLPKNLFCKKMSWETGLRDKVVLAKIVFNPSVWSAPIEGALIKSAAFNENVATVESEYGYEKEITIIKNHLRLKADIPTAVNQIKQFLQRLK